MQIQVSGKGVDVGEALRKYVEEKLTGGISKYIDRVTSVQAVISKQGHMFRVDINGNLGTHAGMVIKGRGESADAHAAFDEALEKIEKQLRRYKRRITNHHKEKHFDAAPVQATKYVLTSEFAENEEDDKPIGEGVVIAEQTTDIQTLTVSQAVMRMDLQNLPALLFFNSANGRLNVVYRRVDGNISWVDPAQAKAA